MTELSAPGASDMGPPLTRSVRLVVLDQLTERILREIR